MLNISNQELLGMFAGHSNRNIANNHNMPSSADYYRFGGGGEEQFGVTSEGNGWSQQDPQNIHQQHPQQQEQVFWGHDDSASAKHQNSVESDFSFYNDSSNTAASTADTSSSHQIDNSGSTMVPQQQITGYKESDNSSFSPNVYPAVTKSPAMRTSEQCWQGPTSRYEVDKDCQSKRKGSGGDGGKISTVGHIHNCSHSYSHHPQHGPGDKRALGLNETVKSFPFSYQTNQSHYQQHHHKKWKSTDPLYSTPENKDKDVDSESCSSRKSLTSSDLPPKKEKHSEIEKRRRDKMNNYISELSGMVPMCGMSRKLDKLTALRMAVQHIKTLKGSRPHSSTGGSYKPSCISDNDLKHLILQSAEGFIFVVGCDRGRLLFVSESVSDVLHYSQSELLGQSWFDILHPKDVAKVKEQLSSSDLAPREKLIDVKTMLPVKANVPQKPEPLSPGARRSFFCRMKCKTSSSNRKDKQDDDSSLSSYCRKSSSSERKYKAIQCTGFLKSWGEIKLSQRESEAEAEDPDNFSCLVLVGKVVAQFNLPPSVQTVKYRPITFTSRHAIDGKFVFVDPRATLVMGFLPQELIGTSIYEYFHHLDIPGIAVSHKATLTTPNTVSLPLYRFKSKDTTYIFIQSTWKAFRNPWSKEIDFIIAKNEVAGSQEPIQDEGPAAEINECGQTANSEAWNAKASGIELRKEIQRLIITQVPLRKIGEQIADEMLEAQRRSDNSSSNSPISVPSVTAADSTAISTTAAVEGLILPSDDQIPVLSQPLEGNFVGSNSVENTGNFQDSLPELAQQVLAATQKQQQLLAATQQQRQLLAALQQKQQQQQQQQQELNNLTSFPAEQPVYSDSGDENSTTLNLDAPARTSTSRGGETVGDSPCQATQMTETCSRDPVFAALNEDSPTNMSKFNNSNNSFRTNGNNTNELVQNPVEQPLDESHDQARYMMNKSVLSQCTQKTGGILDGANDEAEMAVIMSLLEADAGLGGEVDFTGLPWPLP